MQVRRHFSFEDDMITEWIAQPFDFTNPSSQPAIIVTIIICCSPIVAYRQYLIEIVGWKDIPLVSTWRLYIDSRYAVLNLSDICELNN